MRIKNLKIATQLELALGSLLLLFVVLCVLSWNHGNSLWRQTATLYNHPMTVQMAVAKINAAVLGSQGALRDMLLTGDTPQSVHAIEADMDLVDQQLTLVADRYLGPRSDIALVQNAFTDWKKNLDEALRALAPTPRTDSSAPALVRRADTATQTLLDCIEPLSSFAESQATQIYTQAEADQQRMFPRLSAFLILLALVCGSMLFHLLASLRTPLRELTRTAGRLQRGDFSQRVAIESRNEFGMLGAAFNTLAGTVSAELSLKEDLVLLAEVMLRKGDLHAFCRNVLSALIHHTSSHNGAVYLLDEDSQEFRHYESIGLSVKQTSFSADTLEGEFGPAIALGQIRRIADIPPDTRFALATVGGALVPREIVTIPIHSGPNVVAVISLASLAPYPPRALRLLEEIRNVLSARLNALILNRKLRDFTAQLEQQNQELELQKKELATQATLLRDQNSALELQKQRLGEASRLKSAFLSNMSHELRTPLNSVIALSEVLNRRLRPSIPAEEQRYLEMIEHNGRQLLELINSILDLSRIEAGREDVRVTPFKLHDLTQSVIDTVEPQAQGKGIELRHLVPADLPLLRSDFAKCRHILQNLIANAVKFTDVGHVEVMAAQSGAMVLITVRDTGIGIQPEQLPFIFDEFRQGDDSTSRAHGGTGLGLAIARKYATMLHGDIDVRSTPGQGSTFVLRLPLNLSHDLPATLLEPRSDPTPRSGAGHRLLVVEDSEPAAIQVRDILSAQGYRVDAVRSGREALARIAQDAPEAMILDLMMSEMDGFEVLRQVRAQDATARLPVLILTAKHITREELSFLEGQHVQQLIQKGGINKADLLTAVAAMISTTPDARANQAPKPDPTPARRSRPRGQRPVILVVEDNPDNLATMRALLHGVATLVEADNGQTGLLAARAHRPDLILMDISLPIMDGFAALDALRADPELRAIPVVAVTANAMSGDRENTLARGFDAYLSKPLDGTRLEQTINQMLEGHAPPGGPDPSRTRP